MPFKNKTEEMLYIQYKKIMGWLGVLIFITVFVMSKTRVAIFFFFFVFSKFSKNICGQNQFIPISENCSKIAQIDVLFCFTYLG